MRTFCKTQSKVQLSLQPIIKNTDDPVNQSKLEADDVRKPRENLCGEGVTIDFGGWRNGANLLSQSLSAIITKQIRLSTAKGNPPWAEILTSISHYVTDFNYVMNQIDRTWKRVGKMSRIKVLKVWVKTTIPFDVAVPMPPSQWTFRHVRSGFFKGKRFELKKDERDQSFSVGVLENFRRGTDHRDSRIQA